MGEKIKKKKKTNLKWIKRKAHLNVSNIWVSLINRSMLILSLYPQIMRLQTAINTSVTHTEQTTKSKNTHIINQSLKPVTLKRMQNSIAAIFIAQFIYRWLSQITMSTIILCYVRNLKNNLSKPDMRSKDRFIVSHWQHPNIKKHQSSREYGTTQCLFWLRKRLS